MRTQHSGSTRHRLGGTLLLVAGLSAAAIGLSGCFDSGSEESPDRPRASARQEPGDLWGRTFTATAVSEGQEPRPLATGTRIRVTFDKFKGRQMVGWVAGCNGTGGNVQITADRLLIGRTNTTLIGCPDDRQEQDEWLAHFFGSNPNWRLSDGRLTLTSDEAVIELEETHR
jgi:heat shock protein HslJ